MTDKPERFEDPKAWPFTIEVLPLDRLFIDTRYQRPVTRMADVIAEFYDRRLVGVMLVSRRRAGGRKKDRYAVVDGQNRREAMMRVGELYGWCEVIDLGADPAQQEAMLFATLQEARKNITQVQKFKAQRFGGDDEAVNVGRILDGLHIEVAESSSAQSATTLNAIAGVRAIYRRHGEDHLTRVLETVIAAYPDERGRFHGEIVNGLALFFYREGLDNVDQARLLLALTEPKIIGGTLATLREKSAARRRGGVGLGGGSHTYTATVIQEAYLRAGSGRWKRATRDD